MSIWLLIGLVAFLTGAALIYAGRKVRTKEDYTSDGAANEEHFKVQLAEIDADVKLGRLDEQGAAAARTELARELLHHRASQEGASASSITNWIGVGLPLTSVLTVVLAIGIYTLIGFPEQPSAPMATRTIEEGSPQAINQAILQVEAQLVNTPDDLDGWLALAPAYMQMSRFQDAANAYRRIIELSQPTPDNLTDLAQALLFADDGIASPAALELLEQAAAMDEDHARSRFYLAGDATRQGDWDNAIAKWNELLALSSGGEPWLEIAQNGLAIAQARGEPPVGAPTTASSPLSDPAQLELIRTMVSGLAARLEENGGSAEEWTRLVRSYLVLGETPNAQATYDKIPLSDFTDEQRAELDILAAEAGLTGDAN